MLLVRIKIVSIILLLSTTFSTYLVLFTYFFIFYIFSKAIIPFTPLLAISIFKHMIQR